jgi:single-strand DNA-binding protein
MEEPSHPHVPYVNDVLLVGRLSQEPLVKRLDSGDVILTWRLIVDRPEEEWRTPRKVVDTFNCTSFDRRLFGPAKEWRPGDMLEVRGSLRRRFWRGGSQYTIMVRAAGPRTRPDGGADDAPGGK